jgi:hypothetical protein
MEAAANRQNPHHATVELTAKVKALDPITSTRAPTICHVTEFSEKGVMVRTGRFMATGTLVQLHVLGKFSMWKVLCCIPYASGFHLGLEFVEDVAWR